MDIIRTNLNSLSSEQKLQLRKLTLSKNSWMGAFLDEKPEGNIEVLITLEGERILGWALLEPILFREDPFNEDWTDSSNVEKLLSINVFVSLMERGLGVGKALVRYAKKIAKQQRKALVGFTGTPGAGDFYSACGIDTLPDYYQNDHIALDLEA